MDCHILTKSLPSRWNKKLNYVIAISKDGVCDVTKRYTKKWHEVILHENSECSVSLKYLEQDFHSSLMVLLFFSTLGFI